MMKFEKVKKKYIIIFIKQQHTLNNKHTKDNILSFNNIVNINTEVD